MSRTRIPTQNPSPYATDEARWTAVIGRDRRAAGAFYYAVKTTGVYCRPGCPSRLPRRENAVFYATRVAAEHAGFRRCRRCHPEGPVPPDQHVAAIVRACRLMETVEATPTLDRLANAAGMSRFHFHRVFKAAMGVTPKAYAAAYRARQVRDQLARGETVTAALYGAGFNSSGRFYAAAPDMLGMAPARVRRGGLGESIRFAVGICTLGSVLVAASTRGVCAIALGDDPEALVHELEDRFANARLIGGEADFEQWVARVVSFIEAPARGLDLPLDVRGTAFQQRVWKALREIPFGATATYAEIARRIDQPHAVRAVANACAANPLAVAIPCHRVIRTDGGVSGYRWGVDRKRALLQHESTVATGAADLAPPAGGNASRRRTRHRRRAPGR